MKLNIPSKELLYEILNKGTQLHDITSSMDVLRRASWFANNKLKDTVRKLILLQKQMISLCKEHNVETNEIKYNDILTSLQSLLVDDSVKQQYIDLFFDIAEHEIIVETLRNQIKLLNNQLDILRSKYEQSITTNKTRNSKG